MDNYNNSNDFFHENIVSLNSAIEILYGILNSVGLDIYLDLLFQIRDAANNRDIEKFNSLIKSNSLFGGAGALWEIWIDDTEKRESFRKAFCQFIYAIKKMGIKNERIDNIEITLCQKMG